MGTGEILIGIGLTILGAILIVKLAQYLRSRTTQASDREPPF